MKNPQGDFGADTSHLLYRPYDAGFLKVQQSDTYQDISVGAQTTRWYFGGGLSIENRWTYVSGEGPYTFRANDFNYGPAVFSQHPARTPSNTSFSSIYWSEEQIPLESQNQYNNTWNYKAGIRKYCDWGVHFNDDGSMNADNEGTWYTPRRVDWAHILSGRDNAAELVSQATIYIDNKKYVTGLVILPDDFVLPDECVFISSAVGQSAGYLSNRFYLETSEHAEQMSKFGVNGPWEEMERAGALFLPSTGVRGMFSMINVFSPSGDQSKWIRVQPGVGTWYTFGSQLEDINLVRKSYIHYKYYETASGYYHASGLYNSAAGSLAGGLIFGSGSYEENSTQRHNGRCVRLVQYYDK